MPHIPKQKFPWLGHGPCQISEEQSFSDYACCRQNKNSL